MSNRPHPGRQSKEGKDRYQRYLKCRDKFDSFMAFCMWDTSKEGRKARDQRPEPASSRRPLK